VGKLGVWVLRVDRDSGLEGGEKIIDPVRKRGEGSPRFGQLLGEKKGWGLPNSCIEKSQDPTRQERKNLSVQIRVDLP